MRALISVSNKSGLIDFARGLVDRGFEIVSTGGTAKALAEAGLPVIQVAQVTGAPEMMDGRVKTLHPFVHGGILARRGHPGDREALARHGITPIDLVAVNLYPFRETAAKPSTTFDALIEDIDIGGPSMIRAAAKNFKDVLVVTSPGTTGACLRRSTSPAARRWPSGSDSRRRPSRTPPVTTRPSRTSSRPWPFATPNASAWPSATCCRRSLRGRDAGSTAPCGTARTRTSRPAWYVPEDAGGSRLPAVLQGKELSFTNLLDVDAAARIASEFAEPAAVVIKHTNPCGVATGASLGDAYVRARDADALSAFGGIVGCNRDIDEATAEAIASTFIEAVIGPSITDGALAVLSAKKNLRVVIAPGVFDASAGQAGGIGRLDLRTALGGVLAQAQDRVVEAWDAWPSDGRPGGRHEARAIGSGVEGAALRLARVRPREVQHGHLHGRRPHAGRRGRPDEPRGRGQRRPDEGSVRRRFACGISSRVRRVLPVPRRPRRGGGCRRDGGHSAWRVRARRGSHRGGRRARHRDGLHAEAALPALGVRPRRAPPGSDPYARVSTAANSDISSAGDTVAGPKRPTTMPAA